MSNNPLSQNFDSFDKVNEINQNDIITIDKNNNIVKTKKEKGPVEGPEESRIHRELYKKKINEGMAPLEAIKAIRKRTRYKETIRRRYKQLYDRSIENGRTVEQAKRAAEKVYGVQEFSP